MARISRKGTERSILRPKWISGMEGLPRIRSMMGWDTCYLPTSYLPHKAGGKRSTKEDSPSRRGARRARTANCSPRWANWSGKTPPTAGAPLAKPREVPLSIGTPDSHSHRQRINSLPPIQNRRGGPRMRGRPHDLSGIRALPVVMHLSVCTRLPYRGCELSRALREPAMRGRPLRWPLWIVGSRPVTTGRLGRIPNHQILHRQPLKAMTTRSAPAVFHPAYPTTTNTRTHIHARRTSSPSRLFTLSRTPALDGNLDAVFVPWFPMLAGLVR